MILLKFKTEIKGDSKVNDHDGWITLSSIQFACGRPISVHSGGADRDTGAPFFNDITCVKETDKSSVELFVQSICGKSLGEATIHYMQTGGEKTDQIYLKMTLAEPIVTNYSNASSSDSRAMETFSLNFTKIKLQYIHFDGDKKTEGSEKGWDLAIGKAW